MAKDTEHFLDLYDYDRFLSWARETGRLASCAHNRFILNDNIGKKVTYQLTIELQPIGNCRLGKISFAPTYETLEGRSANRAMGEIIKRYNWLAFYSAYFKASQMVSVNGQAGMVHEERFQMQVDKSELQPVIQDKLWFFEPIQLLLTTQFTGSFIAVRVHNEDGKVTIMYGVRTPQQEHWAIFGKDGNLLGGPYLLEGEARADINEKFIGRLYFDPKDYSYIKMGTLVNVQGLIGAVVGIDGQEVAVQRTNALRHGTLGAIEHVYEVQESQEAPWGICLGDLCKVRGSVDGNRLAVIKLEVSSGKIRWLDLLIEDVTSFHGITVNDEVIGILIDSERFTQTNSILKYSHHEAVAMFMCLEYQEEIQEEWFNKLSELCSNPRHSTQYLDRKIEEYGLAEFH